MNREIFDQQRRPRFGRSNPERMSLAFWEWMIQSEAPPKTDRGGLEGLGLLMRDGKLKSVYGPYRARDRFNVPLNREDGPIWTFDRMGRTQNQLPDGRVVFIGGEHEDFYDPDFYIYNDVVVFGPWGDIEIYSYPKEVFPPTDFHTATVVDDRIVIIGALGYPNDREPTRTPVYSLDLSQYRISPVETVGEMPGWISRHHAHHDTKGIITIRGGEVIHERNGRQRFRRNLEDYTLDLTSCTWQRITNRNWLQFSISQEEGLFVLERHPEAKTLLPRSMEHSVVPNQGKEDIRFTVGGTAVSLTIGVSCVDIIVEGNMPESVATQLAEEIRANTETAIHRPCLLERVQ